MSVIRVAVDAMGGDNAPGEVIPGALEAIEHFQGHLHVILTGPEQILTEALSEYDVSGVPIEVLNAPEVIGMDESPTIAVKTKTRSSMHVGLGAVKSGHAHAFVSAGNTGAAMAASLFILGRLPNVSRPTVLSPYPTTHGACFLADVGTNIDCKPEHLVQFARMGSIYSERVIKRHRPTVALMNIGEEENKGNELVKAAYGLLKKASDIHFIGNIEGRDLLHHGADVVICDGFVGNVMLKLGESVATAFQEMTAEEMDRQNLDADSRKLLGGILRVVRNKFDYQEYGGAPLLGVNGAVLIGHGGSKRRAFERMLVNAVTVVDQDVNGSIAAALAEPGI